MKVIYSTHQLNGNGKVFTVSLKALFCSLVGTNSNPAITSDRLDSLTVQIERAGVSGVVTVPRGTSGDCHYDFDTAGKVMTITVTNLPSGANTLTVTAQTGTNDKVVRAMVLMVKDNATGTDTSEAITFNGQEIILDGNLSEIKSSLENLENRVEELENIYAYGVTVQSNVSSPLVTRVGNMDRHRTLPIQSGMVGGLLTDDGTFTPFTNQSDWTSETRDGSLGQVMVKIPEHWRKITQGNGYYTVMLSDVALTGYDHVGEMYCSAYEAALDRTNNKLCSIVNTSEQYRGGNNNADWDNTYRSLLGRPATELTQVQFRTAARNRAAGWEQFNFYVRNAIVWLFVVEYATLNSQAAINTALDANGCKQGGLGVGVSNWNNSSWFYYNEKYPFVPCGQSDSLGNGTGEVDYVVKDADDTTLYTAKVNRYRGIEMPFGHTWKFVDGVIIEAGARTSASGTGKHKVFVAPDPANWGDTDVNDESKYDYVADQARSEGYIKTIDAESTTPLTVDGSDTTYYCDLVYTSIPSLSVELRCLFVGGFAIGGGNSGLFCFFSRFSLSYSGADLGTRLTYIG